MLKNDLTKAVDVEEDIYSKEILGSVGSPVENMENDNAEPTADSLKLEITEYIKSLTPPQKTAMKKKLTDAKLPTAFKSVTDISVLEKVLETIKA